MPKSDTVRITDGTPQVYIPDHGWVRYPITAEKLIAHALENGWGTDDGIPVRRAGSGDFFIRVLVGREPGFLPGSDRETHPDGGWCEGHHFHIVWFFNPETQRWIASNIFHRSTGFDGWQSPEYVSAASKCIGRNPAKIPTQYAEARN
jgi:hypothetical protein